MTSIVLVLDQSLGTVQEVEAVLVRKMTVIVYRHPKPKIVLTAAIACAILGWTT
jgi:hypothetical protein